MKRFILTLALLALVVVSSGFEFNMMDADKLYLKGSGWGRWFRFSYCEIDATEAMMMYAGSGVTITPGNYNFLTAATTVNISSSSAADTGEISYTGIDSNWDKVSATVTMTGQTPVTVSNMLRMIRMKYVNDVSGTNTGSIYAYTGTESSGVPTDTNKILVAIPPGMCTTQGTVTTLSDTTEFAMIHNVYVNGGGKASEFWINIRDNNFANPTIQKIGPFTTTTGGDYFESAYMHGIGAKCDVFLTGKAGLANQSFLTGYDLIYKER